MVHFPTIKKLLAPYKTKYLAVSGGIDSMTMLDIMSKIYSPDELIVCYFEHNPDSPRGEDEFIKQQLKKKKRWRGIKFETTSFVSGFGKYSFEAIARNQRYNWLARLSNGRTNCVVTAHHQDDQIETVLFKLFTNRKVSGIQTILPWQKTITYRKPKLLVETDIIRPLLPYTKSELVDWASRHDIPFMQDPTNFDEDYADRNFIRNEILPRVQERFGRQGHLLRLIEENS